jgi:hypothetical protein
MKDVLHNQADRIDDMTMRITSCEGASGLLRVAASSNRVVDTDTQACPRRERRFYCWRAGYLQR